MKNYQKFENNLDWFSNLDLELTKNFPQRLFYFWSACKMSKTDAADCYDKLEQYIEDDMNKITNYDDMIIRYIHYEDMAEWLDTFLWRTKYRTNGSILQCEYYTWVEETLGLDTVFTESFGLRTKFMELYNKNDLRKLTKAEEEEVRFIDKQETLKKKLKQVQQDFN